MSNTAETSESAWYQVTHHVDAYGNITHGWYKFTQNTRGTYRESNICVVQKKAWGENELQITNLSPNYTRSNSTQRNLCTA